jgi:hypothetical protein
MVVLGGGAVSYEPGTPAAQKLHAPECVEARPVDGHASPLTGVPRS